MGIKQSAEEIDLMLAKLIKEQSKGYPRPIDQGEYGEGIVYGDEARAERDREYQDNLNLV